MRVKILVLIGAWLLLAAGPLDALQAANPVYTTELLHPIPMVTSIVWAADGRMFFTEKSGAVRVVSAAGDLQEQPVLRLAVRQENEDGLLSIALDPDFATNGYFYVYYTPAPAADGSMSNLIVRYTEQDGKASAPVTLLRFPNESPLHQHHGGRIVIDPAGYFYVSVGDLSHWNVRSQQLDQIEGKIHRFALVDGQLHMPEDNPFPDSSVWAFGLRNVFAFVIDEPSKSLLATYNGPDCDDGILSIAAGDNFGWGLIAMSGDDKTYCDNPDRLKGAKAALVSYTPTIAPTGIALYDGSAFPELAGHLLFCAFKPAQMFHVPLTAAHDGLAGEPQPIHIGDGTGCSIDLAIGPDGGIYYTTIMGIYRLVPAA